MLRFPLAERKAGHGGFISGERVSDIRGRMRLAQIGKRTVYGREKSGSGGCFQEVKDR